MGGWWWWGGARGGTEGGRWIINQCPHSVAGPASDGEVNRAGRRLSSSVVKDSRCAVTFIFLFACFSFFFFFFLCVSVFFYTIFLMYLLSFYDYLLFL